MTTHRRNDLLRKTLASVGEQRLQGGDPRIVVIVVDNAPDAPARAVVGEAASMIRWTVEYLTESKPNISASRNRAIEAALAMDVDVCAFIDDDEIARPDWLDSLIGAMLEYDAEVVSGRVVPNYGDGVPEWVREGGLYDFPDLPTGSPIGIAFTGNVLMRTSLLKRTGLRFDEAFGHSGGEDTHFFMRAKQLGTRMVWSAESAVVEEIPASRVRIGAILRRAFRIGVNTVRCERAVLPLRSWLGRRIVLALGSIAGGIVGMAPALLSGRASVVRSARRLAHGTGCILGLAGIRVRAY